MTTDLHALISAAVNRRMELARAASDTSPSPWTAVDANHAWIHDATNEPLVAGGWLSWEEAQLIAANDPADTIRRCEAELAILAEVASWKHRIVEDCWYTCPAATEEVEGERCCDVGRGPGCDCGIDRARSVILGALAAALGLGIEVAE